MAPDEADDRAPNGSDKNILTGGRDDPGAPPEGGSVTEQSSAECLRCDRRSLLKVSGAAASVTVLSGLAPNVSAATTRHGVTFDTVLNAVDDLGMDPTGNEPIDDALERSYESGTLIEFPTGDYAIDDGLVGRGVSNFGIRGLGDSHRDVTFTPQTPLYEPWLNVRSGGAHLVENLSLEQTSDDERSVAFVIRTTGGSVMKNVEWLGRTPEEGDEGNTNRVGFLLTFDVTDQDGVGLVEDVAIGVDEPAAKPPYPRGRPAIRQGPSHEGEAIFRRLTIHDQGSSALRATENPGVATIEDCEFVDNANANLRFGAGKHPSKRSVARNCSIHLTSDATEVGDAIRLHSNGASGALVEDTTVVVESGGDVHRGAIALPDWGDHGRTTFRNVVVRNDLDGLPTVFAEPTDATNDVAIIIENCSFTGSAQNSRGTVYIEGRDGTTIRDSCIQTTGSGQDGIRIDDSSNCEIANTNINVDGDATVFNNASVDTSGISYSDSCRLPGDGSTGGTDGSSGDSTDGGTDDSTGTLNRTLTVDGSNAGRTDYTFTVSGDLAENPDLGTLGTGDSIDGSTATGFVNGGTDGYWFSGEVTDITVDGDADILIDGAVVDPTSLGEPGPTVGTDAATEITDTAATLHGSLDDLGGADSADVAFEWRAAGASSWNSTATETLSATGSFSRSVSGLSSETTYEYRAVATASDGDAATGSTVDLTTTAAGALEHTLTVDGSNAGWTDYTFTVSGDLAENPDLGTLGTGDSIDGSTATGFVNGGTDGYWFSGEVTDITVDGDADILIDGAVVDPSTIGGSEPTLPHELEVRGTGSEASYTVTVSDEIAGYSTTLEDGDGVTNGSTSASGTVTADGESDVYHYSGEVTSVETSGGDAEVYLDGTRINPAAIGLPNTLVVDGKSADAATTYQFSVTGELARDPRLGTLEDTDSVQGGTADGRVTDDVDGYRFSGDVTALSVEGNAVVTFEDND